MEDILQEIPNFNEQLNNLLAVNPDLTNQEAITMILQNNNFQVMALDEEEVNPKAVGGNISSKIYCFKCRQKTSTKDLNKVLQNDKNGNSRMYLKGRCAICGTNKSQIASGSKGGMLPVRQPPGSPSRGKKHAL